MKINTLLFISWVLCCPLLYAQDTFSIIAVDTITGEIGAAGATCVDGSSRWGGVQVINKIIPGRGGINAQAWICLDPHINLENGINQMQLGLSPDDVIAWLMNNDACVSQNFNPAFRQYGIVDMDENGSPRVAAFTGSLADNFKGHVTGENYAIQGNILIGPEILEEMERRFKETEGTLAEKLMAAMQGANMAGADVRCLNRGTSATSAFLRVFRPDDPPLQPYLELSIAEMPFGQEPIDSLQKLFDREVGQITSIGSLEKKNNLNLSFVSARQSIYLHNPDNIMLKNITLLGFSGSVLYTQVVQVGKDVYTVPIDISSQLVIVLLEDESGAIVHSQKLMVY